MIATSSNLVSRLKQTGERLAWEAALRIEKLEQLVSEMEDIRTGCLERDDEDDERHAWKERENSYGIYWACRECGKTRRTEP